MRDFKRIADRYIGRDGASPEPQRERTGIDPGDLLAVANFIGWHDDNDLSGGVKATDAFDALCRIVGIPRKVLGKIVGRPGLGSEGR